MDKITRQFVIQQHTTPDGVHWDLMLEGENILWTWRMHVPPEQILQEAIPIERIADHPLRFLSYEGSVQNQTGSVKITDRGDYDLAIRENTWIVELRGHLLSGRFLMTRKQEPIWDFCRQKEDEPNS